MTILEAAIGWLAPTQCVTCGLEGPALCQMCEAAELLPHGERCGLCGSLSQSSKTCVRCRRGSAPLHIWISTDYEGAAQKLLQTYKFKHQRAAAKPLAALMQATFEFFNEPSQVAKKNYLVVFVPTATSRVRTRSFDHSALLARTIAKNLNLEFGPVITRLGQDRQVGAKRAQRLAQQRGAYRILNPRQIDGRNILVIDDVLTTGSTLRAVYKILKANGAKQIDGLVFAKRL